MLLTARSLTKAYGASIVLHDVSFVLNASDRIGVVGPNGVGKSTLLRILMGQEEPESGKVSLAPNVEIGYQPQQASDHLQGSGTSIQDLLLQATGNLRQLEKRMHELEMAMAVVDADLIEPLLHEYSHISSRFEDLGGYKIEYRIDQVLSGLHINTLSRERHVETLSGGERARVGLAALLLRSPDVLLLDEPTNHLDFASMEWLEAYLTNYRGALLMVSHDRQFLNRAVNQIFEINEHDRSLHSYTGNYDAYVQAQANARAKWEADYERQQEEILELRKRIKDAERNVGHAHRTAPRDNDKFVRYFLAQGKQNAVSNIVRTAEVQLERIEANLISKPPKLVRVTSQFITDPLRSQEVITLANVSKQFGENKLFQDITHTIQPEARILLTGPNGAGKTTLFKIIMGQEQPDSGQIQLAPGIRLGYLSQEAETLDPDKTVLEAYRHQQVGSEGEFIGRLLGHGLFRLEDIQKKVRSLSHGQKRKLEIACLMAQHPNVLLLDEPTNYISLDVLEAFEEAILQFPGPVIAISHDRWFIQRYGGELWTLDQGQLSINTERGSGYLHATWQDAN
ncbi:ribosomal protection-like ABC-F family protein [Ktedonospora formicarum]|uniref:ABC transporter ATP-binding protein n=1 Tax=Ktedonospora formicarum TaxID=2778364 RepID=A0A8J3I2X3_9CHLR|nr:ABC-F type ribosomal protection protein [Ktedonospora formicarum]GHO49127.1 ABC transporter ATP-binding protein [Ktedonospora formicarum]